MGSTPPFPNDGSFLERFKQMQGATTAAAAESPTTSSTGAQPVSITIKKNCSINKPSPAPVTPSANGNGKLAFSLKAKARPAINPLKLGDDDDDDEVEENGKDVGFLPERQAKKQKSEGFDGSSRSAPPVPVDPDVKKVADKLATFVAKSGREFEDITRQKNPTDPRFGFLFDAHCPDYKYYEHRLAEEELLIKSQNATVPQPVLPPRQQAYQPPRALPRSNFQTPASALFENGEEAHHDPEQEPAKQTSESDSLAMMDFYMKKAAQEDLRKPPKFSKDEMPPPLLSVAAPPYAAATASASAAATAAAAAAAAAQKRGHHMGDYIPQEELERFMAKCNDAVAQKQVLEATEKAKIQADNVGHRLLSKMGWKEGEGLGSGRGGRSDPVQAGQVKLNNLGLGAEHPGEVSSEDDIYEQYKKRMMLGYRFRPNPLNNPRKAYY